ncbi:MAG: transposase [Verrucomicrobiae bacterium]|nr:transposase [Verrucomicrobiae bacterium]
MENKPVEETAVRLGRRHFSAEQIQKYLSGQRQSGKPVSVFCRERGIVTGNFYRWRREQTGHLAMKKQNAVFAELPMGRLLTSEWAAEVTLPGGICLRLRAGLVSAHGGKKDVRLIKIDCNNRN